jgi:hypothetical protein
MPQVWWKTVFEVAARIPSYMSPRQVAALFCLLGLGCNGPGRDCSGSRISGPRFCSVAEPYCGPGRCS